MEGESDLSLVAVEIDLAVSEEPFVVQVPEEVAVPGRTSQVIGAIGEKKSKNEKQRKQS